MAAEEPQATSYTPSGGPGAAGPAVIRGINWRETFPFTHLFRAFRIAVHPSKLVLGLVLLLSLYAGGRLLDAIWPARQLAVPGEVFAYESTRHAGAAGNFTAERAQRRAELEAAYADQLVAHGVLGDRGQARAAARTGDKLGELRDRLENERRDAVTAAEARRRDAYAVNESDAALRDSNRHAADEAYRRDVAAAHRAAYDAYRQAKAINGVGIFSSLFEYQTAQISNIVYGVIGGNWLGGWRGDEGAAGIVPSIINFFTVAPLWLMRHHPVYFVLFSLLFLTLWAIFGGAIARIAAVHVARDEKLSVRAALQFSIGKFLSFVSAPLIPLVIVLAVGLLPLLAGVLQSIPFVGPVFNILIAALFVLLLAAGFVMTLVLLGTFGGLNLMYPTIAVEGSDSFDAISRSFSYVYARPWRMLFYTLVALIYGALTYLFVRLFIHLMLALTHAFVDAGSWADAPSGSPLWQTMWPGPGARLSYDIDFLSLRWDQDIAASLVAFWVYLVVGTLGAYAISFYFSANTIIYYLMRQEVDATELDDVYLDQSDDDFAADVTAPVAATEAPTDTAPAGTANAGTDAGAESSGGGAKVYPASGTSDASTTPTDTTT
jgi:hypothetical protein